MIDGVFVSYLVRELQSLEKLRIGKLGVLTEDRFFLSFSGKEKLLFDLNANTLHLRKTESQPVSSSLTTCFFATLKRYLEGSILASVDQYGNDRILLFTIIHFDELGYRQNLKLIFELFGRNGNLILTGENKVIIDCHRRFFGDENSETKQISSGVSSRIIIPKSIYRFPKSEKINPFTCDAFNPNINNLEGVSGILFAQLVADNSLKRIFFPCVPTLIRTETKTYFHAFDLPYLSGTRETFKTLSELLEYYFRNIRKETTLNNEQLSIRSHVNKQINRTEEKIAKQTKELEEAEEHLADRETGELLASNLHLCHPGDREIIVTDFFHDNVKRKIPLNPLLTPERNLAAVFNRYKKAKRAVVQIRKQIDRETDDLRYYRCLLNQLATGRREDLREIIDELKPKPTQTKKKSTKPHILKYRTDDAVIYVGKNNLQNNYLTSAIASKKDFFFHVQAIPGSHVILKAENPSPELIKLAATIAACHSAGAKNTTVCVNYTPIVNVKRVPGIKGSFVTYRRFQSIFVKPDREYIKSKTKTSP